MYKICIYGQNMHIIITYTLTLRYALKKFPKWALIMWFVYPQIFRQIYTTGQIRIICKIQVLNDNYVNENLMIVQIRFVSFYFVWILRRGGPTEFVRTSKMTSKRTHFTHYKDCQLKIEAKFSLLQVYKICSKLNDILRIVSILTKL